MTFDCRVDRLAGFAVSFGFESWAHAFGSGANLDELGREALKHVSVNLDLMSAFLRPCARPPLIDRYVIDPGVLAAHTAKRFGYCPVRGKKVET